MKNSYKKMTDEDFDSILAELLIRDSSTLLHIPGLYEVVSEHYNNEVLDIWKERNHEAESDYAEEDDESDIDTMELEDKVFGDGE